MHALPLVLLSGCLALANARAQTDPGTAPVLPDDHPKIEGVANAAAGASNGFDLEARAATHWAWQPLRDPTPPPSTKFSHPVDRFLDAARRARGLTAAPRASLATLVRRAHFDIVGLPPTRAELERWTEDRGDDVATRLVDTLLASRHYGEHWGRHWLDLVRYSETMGHEFDYPLPNAWRYRDYLIRALNADVPYDVLVREHIAGDLIADQRRDAGGANESITGTVSYWFVEQTHSPVDNHLALADRIDNQIDVITKSFLGMTVSCARCHDHKFDAISTKDYYALYGVLESSRFTLASPKPADAATLTAIRATARELSEQVARTVDPGGVTRLLLRAREQMLIAKREPTGDPELEAWIRALSDKRLARDREHPMHAWAVLTDPPRRQPPKTDDEPRNDETDKKKRKNDKQPPIDGAELTAWLTKRSTELLGPARRPAPEHERGAGDVVFADFDTMSDTGFGDWFVDGDGLGPGPNPAAVHVVPGAQRRGYVRFREGRWADSACLSLLADATLHSPTFTIEKRFVHVLAEGRASRINCVIDGFNLIKDPIYGGLKQRLDSVEPRWYTFDLDMWKGRPAYFQLVDAREHDLAGPGGADDGYFAIQKVVFSDDRAPRPPQRALPREMLGGAPVDSFTRLASRISKSIHDACAAYRERRPLAPHERCVLAWLGEHGLLRVDADLLERSRKLEARLPRGNLIPGMRDGSPAEPHVFVRGSHKTPGAAVARRFLSALGGRQFTDTGSGRLELANELTRPDNPLASRVIVNRIWHHVFGEGLVPTVDNFGVLGQPPSRPELLDWLARRFIADGWSIKKMIRLLMTSEAYRMSSKPEPRYADSDPNNRWLHRANKRRLTGEAIRDAMLTVSGRLDRKSFGPPVPVHLTKFMQGRGRPGSGPVDGNGRRSVYLGVRRNFLSPFFLAFDAPQPFTTIGRRGSSNVPAQALALMNDPFVAEQAKVWAKAVSAHAGWSTEQRIADMYLNAFSRPPTAAETDAATAFLAQHKGDAWADLAHVLFQVKEFIYID